MHRDKLIYASIWASTLLLGFIPVTILSILEGTFWPNNVVDLPLVYNLSVILGDLLVLPIINILIYRFYFEIVGNIKSLWQNKNAKFFLITTLSISLIIALLTHLLWSNDGFSDFIAIERGLFTNAGLWHLFYTFIQTFVILIFLKDILSNRCRLLIRHSDHCSKILLAMLIFTILGILNIIIKYHFIYCDYKIFEIVEQEIFILIPAIAITILYSITRCKTSKTN